MIASSNDGINPAKAALLEIRTDGVNPRHTMVVVINPDLDRTNISDGWHGAML
jgi:hypothetical protein